MGVGGQRHPPAALPPGRTQYPLYRRLCGTQGRSGQVRKIPPPPEFDPRTVQPVARVAILTELSHSTKNCEGITLIFQCPMANICTVSFNTKCLNFFHAVSLYVFMTVAIKNHYFPKEHSPTGLSNSSTLHPP